MAQGVEQVGAFHNNHGKNIVLLEEGTIAYRKAGLFYGIVFTKYAINTGELFEVMIEEMDGWPGTTLVSKNLESVLYDQCYTKSPQMCLMFICPVCAITVRQRIFEGIIFRESPTIGFPMKIA